jgi:nifR3 family TIM-barrel protein
VVVKIGPVELDPPVVLAPMAGVTNAAFRSLCRTYGGALYVSEMISARALVEGSTKSARMLAFGADETTRSVQLYGVDPAVMAGAARMLVDELGVHHVDLNFGCPVGKVTRRGGGAALPLRRALYRAIVHSVVRAAEPVPVTVKLRIGVDAQHVTASTAAAIAEDEGVAAIALHARTAEQLYSGGADWSAISDLKALIRTIPVFGNGDVWDAEDALRMMAETGCDGVVIGRGCLGRPWLFRDLADAFAGRSVAPPPCLATVIDVMRVHVASLCELHGERRGVRDFRKHLAWYLAGYPVGAEHRRALSRAACLVALHDALSRLDGTVELPTHAYRMPRGHTNGPRPVRLPDGWADDPDDLSIPDGADLAVSGG